MKKKMKKVVFDENIFKGKLKYVANVVQSLSSIDNADKDCNEQLIEQLLEDQSSKLAVIVNRSPEEREMTTEELRDMELNSITLGTEEYKEKMSGEIEPSILRVPHNAKGKKPTSEGLYERKKIERNVDVEVKIPSMKEELISQYIELYGPPKKAERTTKKATNKASKRTTKKKVTKKKVTKKKIVSKKKPSTSKKAKARKSTNKNK